SVMLRDMNGDGAPDIYVCNDFHSPDRIWINSGKGQFRAIPRLALRHTSIYSMGVDFADIDRDGYDDFFVVDMLSRHHQERHNQDDILLPIHGLIGEIENRPQYARNTLFLNRGDLTFEEVGEAWGFNTRGVSQGMALADLDGDGDLDVVMNNLNGPAGVYRNESVAPRVAVRLKGLPPNTRGIGAKIWLYGGAVPIQSQEVICGGRYLSSDDPVRAFAAGTPSNEMRIEVGLRAGRSSVGNGEEADRIYDI